MKSYILILVLMLTSLLTAANWITLQPGQTQTTITLLSSSPDRIVFKVSLGGFRRAEAPHAGTQFEKVVIPKFSVSLDVGNPEIPQRVALLAIEKEGQYHARVLSVDYREFRGINLYPAQPQPTRAGDKRPWQYSKQIYQTDAWYPSVNVAAEPAAILRDYRVLPVVIRPLQFNPVQQKIRVAREMTIEVIRDGSGGVNEKTGPAAAESPAFTPLYRSFLLNYAQIRSERTPGVQGLPDMLIITHDNFINEVRPFARWKNEKGVRTTVVGLSDIGPNPTPAMIKSFIQNYYDTATDKPDYLLIVGDVEFVPWFDVSGSKTDLPYYLLEGTDILPDISGGRVSVKTAAEAQRVFAKLVRYEKSPYLADPNWFHSALVINSNDFQDPIAGQWATDRLTAYGYNPVHHLGDDLGNATVSNVMAAVNSGISYLYYIGHGSPSSWGTTGFNTTAIQALTNGEMQPVISTVACNNADLDDANDCFAEVWLKNSEDNGSVGIMGFTESCDAYPPDTLARGMIRALLSDTLTAFGNIVDFGRLHMYQSYGTSASATMYQSLLVGEPELQVWSRTPVALTVTAPSAAFFNIPFQVHVADAQGAVTGALVCYSDTLGHLARAYTDANGDVTLDPGVAEPVSGLLTVTGHNLIPYQAPLDILPPQGPYVMARKLMVTDSAGNNNRIPEAGETISLSLLLENIGVDASDSLTVQLATSDSNLTLLTPQIRLPALAPGDSAVGGFFDARVSPDCPHLHPVPLTITIASGDTSVWIQQQVLTIREGAHLVVGTRLIQFPPTFLNFTSTEALEIGNNGPDTLWISHITSDNGRFSANPLQFAVAPGARQSVQVSFTPDTTLTDSATLIIYSSDVMHPADSLQATGSGIFAPDIDYPDSLSFYAQTTDSFGYQFPINNVGLGELHFSAQVTGQHTPGAPEGSGGADDFGHIWIDSDESGGPMFTWSDISDSGIPLSLTGSNAISDAQQIGFNFPFYGEEYNQLRICTNGWVSFTSVSVSYNNFSLPSNLAPRNLVAPLWDNLQFTDSSSVFVENQGNRFVVMYRNVYTVQGAGPYTFEIFLYDNGNIVFQYLSLENIAPEYTVGIQNQDAQDGLTIAHNQPYLHDSLAVLISKHSWLTISPLSGTIPAQGSLDMHLTIETNNFPAGEFFASIQLESNDPDEPVVYLPVALTVGTTGLRDVLANRITTPQLRQNYPNPFNPSTTIVYALPARQTIELNIYNLLGQRIKTLYRGIQDAGFHSVIWDGTNGSGIPAGSGIYIYKLKTEKREIIKKMVFLK